MKKNPAESLKLFLADTYALALKTHTFHWNVTGPQFYSLHLLFEDQYKDLVDAADTIAERIRALGDFAPGGLKTYVDMSSIDNPAENANAETMLRQLMEDHRKLAVRARMIADETDDARDYGSSDILIERIREHDKQAWMMHSFLKKERSEADSVQKGRRAA